MCRIVGFTNFLKRNQKENENFLKRMNNTLSYGGPDDSGTYVDDFICLGHRRLSVLDLSPLGHQPMFWENYIIVYNGEIYNFEEIKDKLIKLGYAFKTSSDTEVILQAYHHWGKDCVNQFRGMFAFAIWNKANRTLILCRDRVGVKPLYWYKKEDHFMFASELKAFHEHPNFDKTIDKLSVGLYLQQGYIQSPHCIFEYAHKLEPGHFLEVDSNGQVKKTCYWDIEKIYNKSEISSKSEGELLEELEVILKKSFKLRMVADVPVGMFLSGGIDSSLVTAMLQKEYNTSLKTFTIGFDDPKRNEAPFARSVANHIGTDHTEIICTEDNFKRIVPKLVDIYDEPFGDSSSIPTYLVAQLAREQVTVSLSADGGDELFGGYTKYEIAKNYYAKLNKIPRHLKPIFNVAMGKVNPSWLEKNRTWIPVINQYRDVALKFSKLKNAMKANSIADFFNASSVFINDTDLTNYVKGGHSRFNGSLKEKENQIVSFLGMIDIKTYLEGDIMTKVDRATMQVALEGREPFLDQNIIEFSQKIPDSLKIKNKQTKYLLRKVLYKYVPKELIERPKQGFSIPLAKWLRGHLFQDLTNLINDTKFIDFFDLDNSVKKDLQDFLFSKRYVNPHFIWSLFILHKWYLRWI